MKFAIFIFLAVALVKADSENPCEGLDLVFLNDPSSCGSYFSCLGGRTYRFTCPNNYWFYPNFCHPPDTVTCEICPATGVTSVGVDDSCTEYILCINGNALRRECADGTRFDRTKGRCDKEELVTCQSSRCPVGSEVTLESDPQSCSHYFICDSGQEVQRRLCSENLLFDPILRSCALAANVNCGSRPLNIPQVPSRFVGDIPTAPTVVPTAPSVAPMPSAP